MRHLFCGRAPDSLRSSRRMNRPMDRRTFVKRTCLGSAGLLLGGVSDLAADGVVLPTPPPIDVHEPSDTKLSPLRMPGLYPGRVIELFDSRSIASNRVS